MERALGNWKLQVVIWLALIAVVAVGAYKLGEAHAENHQLDLRLEAATHRVAKTTPQYGGNPYLEAAEGKGQYSNP